MRAPPIRFRTERVHRSVLKVINMNNIFPEEVKIVAKRKYLEKNIILSLSFFFYSCTLLTSFQVSINIDFFFDTSKLKPFYFDLCEPFEFDVLNVNK